MEASMRSADSKTNTHPSESLPLPGGTRAVPTFVATDLLERLIADQDALAVRKIITAGRRH
jgi:hypothetical protein